MTSVPGYSLWELWHWIAYGAVVVVLAVMLPLFVVGDLVIGLSAVAAAVAGDAAAASGLLAA